MTVLGIAMGVMVLTTSLSLFNGFTQALIQATLKATPHISIQVLTPKPNPALEKRLSEDPEVVGWSPILGDTGLLFRRAEDGRSAGGDFARFLGIDAREAGVLDLSAEEQQQLKQLKPNQVILGRILADSIGAFNGDALFFLNLEQRRIRLSVAGTFKTGNALVDSAFAFTPIETLRSVNARQLSGYHVRLKNPQDAPNRSILYSAGGEYTALAWQDQNAGVMGQLQLQKRVLGIVVFLIVVVAAFGIANVLLLTVLEKTSEIAILRAMGTSRNAIVLTFVLEGVFLGILGLILGNLLGLGLSYYFQWKPVAIPGDLYFISALSTHIEAFDFLWVNVLSFSVTLFAAFIPARHAANIEPARILR